MRLRDYQVESQEGARDAMRGGALRVLQQEPTGAGKSFLAADTMRRAAEKGRRVRFIVHRGIILEQQADTLTECGIDFGWALGGKPTKEKPIMLSTIQTTLARMSATNKPDFLLIDEAHHMASSSFSRIVDCWSDVHMIGYSATPERLDSRPLDMFQAMVLGKTTRWLINNGYLSDYRLVSVPVDLDMSRVNKTSSGELNQQAVADAFGASTIFGDSVAEYTKRAAGRQNLVFAPNIEYAGHVAGLYQAAGYRAAVIHGKMDRAEIRRIVADFRAGALTVMVSVDLIGEGFSVDGVEVVSILRKTASVARWLQWCGRALRVKPDGAGALILDHGGNYLDHGAPCEEREWSLDGKKKKNTAAEVPAPQTCPRHFFGVRRPDIPCPVCGYLPEVQEREIKEVAGELEEVDILAARTKRRDEERDARTLAELQALARARGYKRGWAYAKFKARQKRRYA